MNEELAMALGGGAIEGMQQADTRNGFFQWLSGNYGQLTNSFRDIACIFRPETCAGGAGAQPPVIIQENSSSKTYFLILGALLLLVLLVLLVKK